MYVSNDIIFIHVPRCGGTSIRTALAFPDHPRTAVPKKLKAHDMVHRAHAVIGDDAWRQAWSFTIVRNPWDRLISLFHLSLSPNDRGTLYTRLAKGLRPETPSNATPEQLHKENRKRGFEWWLLEFCERYRWDPWKIDPDRPITRIPASEWLAPVNGQVTLDRVFRFETDREALLDELRARRGITEFQKIKSNAEGRDRADYFSTSVLDRWVEKHHGRDLEAFGYAR